MVLKSLQRLLSLHPGEGFKASLFCFIALLWGVGGYGTLVLSEGMLLQNVGAGVLPYTYLFVALAFFSLSTLLIFALNHLSVLNILLTVIIGTAALLLFFYCSYPFSSHTSHYWVAFKIFGWIMPISIYICFWAFVDQYFDLQAAKRTFALFNAMLFLGDALGGAIISYALEWLQVQGLILLFAILILSSAALILWLGHRLTPQFEQEHSSAPKQSSLTFKNLIKAVGSSRYTLALLIFYFFMQMVAIITEFTYMEQFESSLKSESSPHHLTQILGSIGMWVSLSNMCFGMFIYSRVVRKMGVNNIILIAPICFMVLYLLWIGSPAISIAIFGVVAREGIIYSLDDNNLNLLLSGVPSRIKNRVRFGVESFFEPAGMLLSACLLLLFQNQSKIIGIILAGVTLIFVFLLRSLYTKAIFTNLITNHLRLKQKTFDWFAQLSEKELKKAEFVLLYNLKQPNESQQLLAFEHLIKLNNKSHLPRLINHINELSLPSKLKALELLGQSNWVTETAVITKLKWWAKTNTHPTFKSALHLYFARHGLLQPEDVIRDIESPHLTRQAASIITLKKMGREEPNYASLATQKLRLMLDSDQEERTIMALNIIGIDGKGDHADVLLPYLRHNSLKVSRQAAFSLHLLSRTPLSISCFDLIKQLKLSEDREVRYALLQTIKANISSEEIIPLILASDRLWQREKNEVTEIIACFGTDSIETLYEFLIDKKNKDSYRLIAAKAIIKIDPTALKKKLTSILIPDIKRAYFYFYHSHTIQKQIPEHNLYMLEKTLESGFRTVFDFIIQLITLSGGIEESDIMVRSIINRHLKIRASAYETLEEITPASLFVMIKPFLDEYVTIQEKLTGYLKGGGMPLNLTQLLNTLSQSADPTEQMIAQNLKSKLGMIDSTQKELYPEEVSAL